ncbi:NAD-dependent DNA ligase LigA, partial [Candidatus Pelagibacter sp.]|nr:NAD-dependent DNA ligase LigA [Candidatus Pelagibacter sp.]
MKDSEIKKYYKRRINELKDHNKHYFEESSPIISDKEYDEIKKEIFNLEKKYLYLKSTSSPSNSLGYTPSKNFVKSKHRVKMLSLSNAFDFKDLENFEKK